ncbi:unnamed protein product [Polarella glacialis]|uniref:Uncharacterized protein n=1 Tax=Polarella glacialis TaxID=89957 RepID=A0A813FD80_POLGL|nr:unnamed protein product [Polarella glacialis]
MLRHESRCRTIAVRPMREHEAMLGTSCSTNTNCATWSATWSSGTAWSDSTSWSEKDYYDWHDRDGWSERATSSDSTAGCNSKGWSNDATSRWPDSSAYLDGDRRKGHGDGNLTWRPELQGASSSKASLGSESARCEITTWAEVVKATHSADLSNDNSCRPAQHCLSQEIVLEAGPEYGMTVREREENRKGKDKTITGYIIARTDHPREPLYCFIVLVSRSDSTKYKEGTLVRPIPKTCVFRDDEMGRFWVKRTLVPEIGSIVELQFLEDDTLQYLLSGHGKHPQQNEDLLCASLELKGICNLMEDPYARRHLMALACENVTTKWPWGYGLSKFSSVTPGKHIWFVPATSNRLPSVVLLRVNRESGVKFIFRNPSSRKVSCNFCAGSKTLSDIPVTAAGYDELPHVLNTRFATREHADHLFVLGLARKETRGPEGFNRLVECPEKARSLLKDCDFEEYCQILLIGIINLSHA